MIGSTTLTAFNDNAAITYLASLVPGLSDALKYVVMAGAVTSAVYHLLPKHDHAYEMFRGCRLQLIRSATQLGPDFALNSYEQASFTPSITIREVPAPSILAPILLRKFARATTSGSHADRSHLITLSVPGQSDRSSWFGRRHLLRAGRRIYRYPQWGQFD
jgi:hypothetical protein